MAQGTGRVVEDVIGRSTDLASHLDHLEIHVNKTRMAEHRLKEEHQAGLLFFAELGREVCCTLLGALTPVFEDVELAVAVHVLEGVGVFAVFFFDELQALDAHGQSCSAIGVDDDLECGLSVGGILGGVGL